MDKLTYEGGLVLNKAIVQPIFWGPEWDDPNTKQSAMNLVDQITQLSGGPYFRGLAQYSNIESPSILAPVFDQSMAVPALISIPGLVVYLESLIIAGTVLDFREFDQLLYFVFTSDHIFTDDQPNGVGGIHDSHVMEGKTFQFAWSALPYSHPVSHELVEAFTNPAHGGWALYVPGGGNEVADICEETPGNYGVSDGVGTVSYWSNLDVACINPKRVANIGIATREFAECRIGPTVGFSTTFGFSYGVEPDWIDGSNLPPLTHPKYQWGFDNALATADSATDQPTLTLHWIARSYKPTLVHLTITADQGIKVYGSLQVRIHTQSEGELLGRICGLRKLLSERKLPTILIDPLGPDGPVLPSETDIEQLNSFASRVAREVRQITQFSEGLKQSHENTRQISD